MKRILFSLLLLFFITSCNKDDGNDVNDVNPFIIEPLVNLTLNLNLPQYNPLLFPGNSVVVSSQGVKGIIIYNVNNTLYTAFDLTDPNHAPNSCSRMSIEGVIASCTCGDENSYDIVTGQHQMEPDSYPMLMYRIQRSGTTITISN